MIKNEKQIEKESVKIFVIISMVMLVLTILRKDISLLLGFMLGYGINFINYQINVSSISYIVDTEFSSPRIVAIFGFFVRFSLYAVGFFLAVSLPTIFSLYTVAIGYLCIRLTIYYLEFNKKGG